MVSFFFFKYNLDKWYFYIKRCKYLHIIRRRFKCGKECMEACVYLYLNNAVTSLFSVSLQPWEIKITSYLKSIVWVCVLLRKLKYCFCPHYHENHILDGEQSSNWRSGLSVVGCFLCKVLSHQVYQCRIFLFKTFPWKVYPLWLLSDADLFSCVCSMTANASSAAHS